MHLTVIRFPTSTKEARKRYGIAVVGLTREIITSACNVHNTLGCGLLEKIYENSLARVNYKLC
ncbi:MAG: hypothetical protein KKH34_09025 [Candidatus Omnitrophica bacterium]|nr:hypothetical protein [Candidatus Omnitrophota bacterium]